MQKLQLLFNNKYSSLHRIGLTKTSQVYLGFDINNQQQLSIKLQKQDRTGQLQRQAKIYRVIKGGVGIPNLYWYGNQHNYRVLVTQNFGPTLDQLLKYCQGKFSLKTVLMAIDQIIDRIQWVHQKKFVYNDIDPQNFLIGLGQKADKIFLVDFGSCKKFVDSDGNHLNFCDQNLNYHYNPRFLSIHGHIGKRRSRRDDLQSLGYMFVYFLKGSLPWDNITEQQTGTIDVLIKQKKVGIPVQLLCQGLPNQFVEYFKYIKNLQYEEEPDYNWIKRLFKDLFENNNYKNNLIFDWAQRHKY